MSAPLLVMGMSCLLAATLHAQPPTAPPDTTLPPALQRVLTNYEDAWQLHNAHALAQLFTSDGFVLANGSPPVRGRAEIECAYSNAGGPLHLHAFAFATEGNLGYIVGGYSRKSGEPDRGKFTLTLRRGSDRRWLIVSDMDNSDKRPDSNQTLQSCRE